MMAKKKSRGLFDDEETAGLGAAVGLFDDDENDALSVAKKNPQGRSKFAKDAEKTEQSAATQSMMFDDGRIVSEVGDYAANKPTDSYVQDVTTGTEPAQTEPAADDEDEKQQGGLFDNLDDVQERQAKERDAMQEELAVRRAEAIQAAQARSGLGGMGLSGASAALRNDAANRADRQADLTMADLGRRQSDERFQELQRNVSVWDLEQAEDADLNGDGFRGNPSLEERPGDESKDEDEDLREGWAGSLSQDQAKEEAQKQGIDLDDVPYGSGLDRVSPGNTPVMSYEDPNWGVMTLYRRPDGTYFVLRTGQSQQDIEAQRADKGQP